jgi:hypothetical protein
LSATGGPLYASLRAAAAPFCPPYEIVAENPAGLTIDLRRPHSPEHLRLRYRSERGLFLRTYYLVVEVDFPGEGPAEAGTLVLRRRRLRWKRPAPSDGERWSEGRSDELKAALKRLQIERLGLGWEPERATWRLTLETLSGSVTVTFFPPLMTPNPFRLEEAEAIAGLLDAVRSASPRRQA